MLLSIVQFEKLMIIKLKSDLYLCCGLSLAEGNPKYLRVNKFDVLQHGSWVSSVVNLVCCHFQFFSNNSGEPYADNTDCQFQYWNWNFMYGTCFFHDKCTVNLVNDIFQTEVNDGWNSLSWPIYIVNSVGKAK